MQKLAPYVGDKGGCWGAGGRVHLRAGRDQTRSSLSNIQAAFESVNLNDRR